MQLEQQSQVSETGWNGTVPSAFDARVLLFVVGTAALAASLNVPYGGIPMGVAAFAILAVGGTAAHLHGERTLRRLTDDLVARWADAGGRIEDVTRTSDGYQTEWTVHTPDGDVTVSGLALTPVSRFSVSWNEIRDEHAASTVDDDLDRLAAEWAQEIFGRR